MKTRQGDAFMSADDYGRSLPDGVGVNLLVQTVKEMTGFLGQVLGARILYEDGDFAAVVLNGSPMMVHADHSYLDHPLHGVAAATEGRGAGLEIRVYGCDPDDAEMKARARGDVILAGTMDKPHGLRECFIIAPEGYIFVPSRRLSPS